MYLALKINNFSLASMFSHISNAAEHNIINRLFNNEFPI